MSDPLEPAIDIRGVTRTYPGSVALDAVSLALRPGRITCLLGPSGCGKSTLLRLIAGLEPVDAGEIVSGATLLSAPGHIVPPEARGVGLVFQDFALFPHLNVSDNIGFGIGHLDARTRRERTRGLLDQFKLAHRADAWPHTLSGGEQQRVAIARALAREPAALLLDEPFSGLDGDLKAEVREVVLSGLRAARAAILMVTHDPEEAMLLADDLALMSGGRLLQSGPPQHCYRNPVSADAARLLGPANLVPAQVEAGMARTPFGAFAATGADGRADYVIRPEALRLAADGASVTIVDVRFGGAVHHVTVEAEGVTATLHHRGGEIPVAGPAWVAIDPARATRLEGDALAAFRDPVIMAP